MQILLSGLTLMLYCFLKTAVSSGSSHCLSTQLACHSGLCLPAFARCDGQQDCPGNDDETDCPQCSDTDGRFACESGNVTTADSKCIYDSMVCDGFNNCANGRDETRDGNICVGDTTCPPSAFTCVDQTLGESQKCIPSSWVCDGESDCADQSDEDYARCNRNCTAANQFQCPDTEAGGGQCISRNWLCDGENDCLDGKDELDCDESCDAGEMRCSGSSSTTCIPVRWQCDGQDDCDHGEDEEDCEHQLDRVRTATVCTNMEFACQKSGQGVDCVMKEWKCDGELDCSDGSDESPLFAGCPSEIQVDCGEGLFWCSEENICVPRELRCNGVVDCSKGTDEMDCPQAEGVCGDGRFRCKSSGRCITTQLTCDNRDSCGDRSDEEFCHKQDVCSSPNPCGTGNLTVCTPLRSPNMVIEGQVAYYDFTCRCSLGRVYDQSSHSCLDDDECSKSLSPCDQICKNTDGSFTCGCELGYFLGSDGVSCKTADSEHPTLVFSSGHDIRQIHVHSSGTHRNYGPLIEDEKAVALDVDVQNRRVFYSDSTSHKIYKFTMPDDNSTTPPTTEDLSVIGVQFPDGLAYDWIHNHLYWTDSEFDTINMATAAPSSLARVLYRKPETPCCMSETVEFGCMCIDEPRAIAVHPKKGWIFWSDWGKNPHIIRGSLDGTKMELINHNTATKTTMMWPNGLTLDLMNGGEERLYWIDAKIYSIYSCSLEDCMADTKLITFSNKYIKHPHSITVFEHSLYWSDWMLKSIYSVNKRTGQNITSLVDNLPQPMGLKMFHGVSQPRMPNVCLTANCSQFCVPKSWTRTLSNHQYSPPLDSTICLCSDGFRLHSDGKTCIALSTSVSGSDKAPSVTPPFSTSGVIAGVTVAVILVIIIIIVAAYCVVKKRREAKSKMATNFENPVYCKTTTNRSEDRMELPANEYQPDESLPPSMVPLTSDTSDA